MRDLSNSWVIDIEQKKIIIFFLLSIIYQTMQTGIDRSDMTGIALTGNKGVAIAIDWWKEKNYAGKKSNNEKRMEGL